MSRKCKTLEIGLFSLKCVEFTMVYHRIRNYEGRLAPNMRTVRFVLIGKSHRLYYRRHGLTLFITQVYNTRQNTDKKPYSK